MKYECVVIATKTNNRENVPYVEVYEYNCQAELEVYGYGHKEAADRVIKSTTSAKIQFAIDQCKPFDELFTKEDVKSIEFKINATFHGHAIYAQIQNLSIANGKVHTLSLESIRNADKASTSGGPSVIVPGMGKFN